MLIKQIIDMYELLDDGRVDGAAVVDFLKAIDPQVNAETYPLVGPRGTTHMVKVRIPGSKGKSSGGDVPTLGILGRLGGLGARPEMIGFVSDGDGALAALAIAAKLLDMRKKGDVLPGDVFISTHICPDAPTQPHDPVPFMGSPVDMYQVNQEEVTPELDAIFSIDTTKGNRVINTRGFAISQPVKEGYILRLPEELKREPERYLTWRHCLVLDGVQDPGNVGTILRTADAFDCGPVFLLPGCADANSPKAVRAAMGVHFRQVIYQCTLEELTALLSKAGISLYAAALREDTADVRELGADKHSPVFFYRCFAAIPGFSRECAVMVGDSLTSDIRGGRDAGLRTCWFNPRGKPARADIVPDYEFSALERLPALLETL